MSSETRKPKKSKVSPGESREDKFKRLAMNRGKKLVHQLKLLNNLGGSYAYKIDPQLAEDLLEQFADALEELRTSWQEAISKHKPATKTSTGESEVASVVETKDEDTSTDDCENEDEEDEDLEASIEVGSADE